MSEAQTEVADVVAPAPAADAPDAPAPLMPSRPPLNTLMPLYELATLLVGPYASKHSHLNILQEKLLQGKKNDTHY